MRSNTGFIALMSAIIISVILLLVTTTLSLNGFYSRSNILDSEMKEKSAWLANACLEKARLILATNPSATGKATIPIGCDYEIKTGGIILAHAVAGNAHTYYRVVVDVNKDAIPINSFTELSAAP